MRIVARSRHPDSAGPVVLEVGELVGERLYVQRQQPRDVLYHIVGGGLTVPWFTDCDTRTKSYLNKMLSTLCSGVAECSK